MRKLKSGFTETSEPIIIRRVSDACGIGTGRRFMNVNSSPFEKDLVKLIFFWNLRDNGLTEEEIQQRWDMTPWGDKNVVQADQKQIASGQDQV